MLKVFTLFFLIVHVITSAPTYTLKTSFVVGPDNRRCEDLKFNQIDSTTIALLKELIDVNCTLELWDIENSQKTKSITIRRNLGFDYSADGSIFAVAYNYVFGASSNKQVYLGDLIDISTGKSTPIEPFESAHMTDVQGTVSISADSKSVAVGVMYEKSNGPSPMNFYVSIYDISTGSSKKIITKNGVIISIVYAGSDIVFISLEVTSGFKVKAVVYVVSVNGDVKMRAVLGKGYEPRGLDVSGDGKRILVCDDMKGTFWVLDYNTGNVIYTEQNIYLRYNRAKFIDENGNYFGVLAQAADEYRNCNVTLVDVNAQEVYQRIVLYDDVLYTGPFDFSKNGEYLVIGSDANDLIVPSKLYVYARKD